MMFTAGIDPGLTETGMVLLSPEGHYLSGVTYRAAKDGPDLQRIVNLADVIVGTVKSWVFDHKIRELLIGLEYPIVKGGNVYALDAYRKQINLLHEIEAGLWRWHNEWHYDYTQETGRSVRILEVNPSASKRAATGDGRADKADIIAASPFERRDDIRRPTREALADAWAHCIAARIVAGGDRLIELEGLARERLAPQFVDTKVFRVEAK